MKKLIVFCLTTCFSVGLQAQKTIEDYRVYAEQGDADAQYHLGMHYIRGDNISKDTAQAVYWWRSAAEQGHVEAQYNLGMYYFRNSNVTKDDITQAVYWFSAAAEQGESRSQYWFGVLYSTHFRDFTNISRNKARKQGVYWYLKSAEQGNALAQGRLGYLYMKGIGVKRDRNTALFWFEKLFENEYLYTENFRKETEYMKELKSKGFCSSLAKL